MADTTGVILDELNAEFGDYHRDISTEIEEKATYDHETANYMTVIDDTVDQKAMAKDEMTEVSQAANLEDPTFKGAYKIEPEVVKTDEMMIAYKFLPKVLRKSWAKFLVRKRLTKDQFPFIYYIMSKLTNKFMDEHETLHIGKGFRRKPEKGIAGPAINAMSGYLTMIRNLIISGDIIPIDLGYFNDDTIGDYVNRQLKKIPYLFRNQDDLMCVMSPDNELAYKEATGQDSNVQYTYVIDKDFDPNVGLPTPPIGKATVKKSKIKVVGLPSMIGSNLIFFIRKSNFKKVVEEGSLQFEEPQLDNFHIKILGTMNAGVGFTWPTQVWVCGSISETPIVSLPSGITTNSVDLFWETAWVSAGYEFDVSTTPDFSAGSATTAVSGMETNNVTINELDPGTTYYVRGRSHLQKESSTTKFQSFNSEIQVFETPAA